MKAVILAAGIASRLRPLTNDRPKCLLEIGGKCLLQRSFDGLIQNGITEFVVVTGYLHEQIEAFLNNRYQEVSITYIYNEQYASTNNI
jgi:NDP-sugar pyrophosphorylase family protein